MTRADTLAARSGSSPLPRAPRPGLLEFLTPPPFLSIAKFVHKQGGEVARELVGAMRSASPPPSVTKDHNGHSQTSAYGVLGALTSTTLGQPTTQGWRSSFYRQGNCSHSGKLGDILGFTELIITLANV